MQQWFTEHWDNIASNEPSEIDDPGDFGFYDVEMIRELGPEYYASGRNPGHLPYPGGILMQTSALRHDLMLYLWGIAWRRWEQYRLKKEQDEASGLS